MEKKIIELNQAYSSGGLSLGLYELKARSLLSTLTWDRRIRYANMLYISIA